MPRTHAFVLHESGRPFLGATWMRGITVERLGVMALVILAINANNEGFVDDSFLSRAGRVVFVSAQHFIAAIPMFIVIVKAELWTASSAARIRIPVLALAVLVGAALFSATRWGIRFGALPQIGAPGSYWEYSMGHFFRAVVMGGFLTVILYLDTRERDAQRLLHRARLARVEIDRQMTEARLQLLQAQIEPHFLFNSLASVKRLYEKEPGEGRSLMRHLGEYLRVAIPRARARETRLGDEVALAQSFLSIFKVRMGRRLAVRVTVPSELESAGIPPLMIGTLVENAIKHGIGPRASGGTVTIVARSDGDFLEVMVKDDGVGFRARSGTGTGLANIRARLATLFATEGRLDLAANADGGVAATIRLPHRLAPEGAGTP